MAKYNITEKKEKEATYRTLVNPKLMDELKEKILDAVIIQKKYKIKDYSAKQLAMDLGTNTRYISAVVNVRFHMNYTSFINNYRVEEAMSLLTDRRYQELNMEDISDMVGFSNRQSFYAAFFKVNGITPREYKLRSLTQHPALAEKPKKRGRKPSGKKKTTKHTQPKE
ncbi:MAG: AraC family transcriptional regulator [Prevotella sp.]|nr:AraC family transcriptional regulator [Prevotella sp.]